MVNMPGCSKGHSDFKHDNSCKHILPIWRIAASCSCNTAPATASAHFWTLLSLTCSLDKALRHSTYIHIARPTAEHRPSSCPSHFAFIPMRTLRHAYACRNLPHGVRAHASPHTPDPLLCEAPLHSSSRRCCCRVTRRTADTTAGRCAVALDRATDLSPCFATADRIS